MSRSSDCKSANNHQLVWMDMTRPVLTLAMVTQGRDSAPLPAVSRIRAAGSNFLCGAHSPEGRPNNVQPREG
jgi:hypothetical protein